MRVDEILIEAGTDAWRAAVISDKQLFDLVRAPIGAKGVEGDIYLGRVVRVLPGMGGAFVEVGLDRPALMEIRKTPPREGDVVTVQLVEPATQRKAARVARRIALAGAYLVLLPEDAGLTVSKKLKTPRRSQVTGHALDLDLAGEGLIVRTAAEQAPKDALRAEHDSLRARWQQIDARRTATANPPATLYQTPPAERLLNDLAWYEHGRIVADTKTTARVLAEVAPGLAPRIVVNTDRERLFERYDIADAIADLDAESVALPSGGVITIQALEALTAIDVDSGTNTDAKLRLATNLEAAREIARQIRLRDIRGVIVVDFLRLDAQIDRKRLHTELSARSREERRNVVVYGEGPAGLFEMLRHRR
jgi:ribonuclease G